MELLEREWIGSGGPVDSDSLWDPSTNASRPRILTRLNAFISLSKKTGHFPLLTDTFNSYLSFLKDKWAGTNELDLYPVFNNSFSKGKK